MEKTFIRCKDCWTNDNFDISRNRIWYLSNGFETSTWASCWNTHMVLHKKMEKQHFRSNQSLVWHFEDLMVWIMYIKRDSFWDKKIHFHHDNYSVVAIINKKNPHINQSGWWLCSSDVKHSIKRSISMYLLIYLPRKSNIS